ncbi:MAG TPA: hypothetical protein PKZ78_09740 [Candidatus Goldiibacteriota bacterium]|jgi:hypothetical protein|nr:hypothetical protein [Candidatus Goldiibacteriota bacterium]
MKDVMNAQARKAQHEAGLKRIRKGGARMNKTKACISVSPVILKALHRKAAAHGKNLSDFFVEAASHYTPADITPKKEDKI